MLNAFVDRLRRRRFARMLMARIRQAGETVRYDLKEFCLYSGDSVSYLANVYAEYQQAPEDDREGVIDNYERMRFAMAKGLPEEFDDLHPDLLPIVRPRSHFELATLQGEVTGKTMATVPRQILAEHLAVALVYDRPESMQTITEDDLARWGVTFYEALEAAQRNLAGLKYAVGGLQGEPIMVEWDRLTEVAGNLLEPLDMYPERYRVVDFLSESQLELLRE